MLSIFKKKEQANVIAFSIKPYIQDCVTVLNNIKNYFNSTVNINLQNVTYCNAKNEDIDIDIDKLFKLDIDDVSLLNFRTNSDMEKEKEVSIGFYPMDDDELLFYCMVNKKNIVNLLEFYNLMGIFENLNYSFIYEITIGIGTPAAYLLDDADSNKTVLGLPANRIKQKKMWCFIENKELLLQGVMKDVFMSNMITELHMQKIRCTSFYDFIVQHSNFQKVSPGVYFFEFISKDDLDRARELAYAEKLVLCP